MNPQDHAHRATIQVLHTPIHAQEDRCMSYSPQIADAKRRARASARTTGTSYQSELENEAKALGYERWSDLISGDSPENAQDSHKKDPDSGKHRDLRAIRLTAGRLCSANHGLNRNDPGHRCVSIRDEAFRRSTNSMGKFFAL